MKCPYCHSDRIRVIDTRKFDTVVIRIRVCDECTVSFQTQEQIVLQTPLKFTVSTIVFPK